MSLDSTANLLFTIGANTDDAQGNIQAFRSLLGKSLSDIGGDFDDWKTKVLGDISTVEGAMMAGGAAGDILDYETHRETGFSVIAIGGDKLARGLTLEGLSVSYFLRASKMYDTLMHWPGCNAKVRRHSMAVAP